MCNLVTLSERMSRFTLVAYVAAKESDAVMAVRGRELDRSY